MSAQLARGERIRAKLYCMNNDGSWDDPYFNGESLTVSVRGEQIVLRGTGKTEVNGAELMAGG